MSAKKKIFSYILITLIISYIYQGFIYLTVSDINSDRFSNLILGLMYLPGLVALFVTWRDRESLNIKPKFKHPIFLLYALIIPLGLTMIFVSTIGFLGIGNQSILNIVNNKVVFLGREQTSIISFIGMFLVNFSLASVFTGMCTLGEELGWRGYLQSKLVKEFGVYGGITLLGTVWGYWHLPIILMGYNYPEYPWLGALVLMPLTTIGFSGVFAWLTLNKKNIWFAILAHGAINNLLSDTFISRIEANNMLLVYSLLAFIWLIAGIISMVAISKSLKRKSIKNLVL